MRRKKRILGALIMIAALIIMQLPVSEADAASASDFKMEGETLVSYRGTEKNVSVPDTVQVIGREAFEGNDSVEMVIIPNSVKRIEPYAFWGCDKLERIVLGNGLYEIGDFAFAGCYGLKQMTITENITAIGIQAFADCYHMTDISIPSSCVNIHETAFDCCYKLNIHANPGSIAYIYAQDFYERMEERAEYEDVPGYDSSETLPVQTPAPTEKPEDAGALLGSSYIVGNSAYVFVDTDSLQVYQGYPGSEPEELPLADMMTGNAESGIPKYTIVDGRVVADQAYYRSTALNKVSLPAGIKEIGQFSFARSSVTAISIPENVIKIGYGAFYHCDYLENVSIPDTVQVVEPKAFDYTGWVERFLNGTDGSTEDFLVSGGVLVAYRGVDNVVNIPEGVRLIAGEVFRNHNEITDVVFPEGLVTIGEGAFEGCKNLERIQISDTVENIKDRAFFGTALTKAKVVLPMSVKCLGLQAFGDAEVKYKGFEAPVQTYEDSATRLSNAAYRGVTSKGTNAGVTAVGLEGITAVLDGADRSYTLSVGFAQDTGAMEMGCLRSFKSALPDSMLVYNLKLTDESGIPIYKLGNQKLTVAIPVPDGLKGQELSILTLDRNGQPEFLNVKRATIGGVEVFCFSTTYVSQVGVYSTGYSDSGEELLELNVELRSMSAGPGRNGSEGQSQGMALWMRSKFWLSMAVFLTGLVILISAGKRTVK